MVWFWLGGTIAAAGLTWWAHRLARQPATPGWLRWLAALPGLVWVASVAVSAWFTWRAFADLAEAPAHEKQAVLAGNVSWAMNATGLGVIGLVAVAAVLAGMAVGLRRRARSPSSKT